MAIRSYSCKLCAVVAACLETFLSEAVAEHPHTRLWSNTYWRGIKHVQHSFFRASGCNSGFGV